MNNINNNIFEVSPEFKDLFEKMICPKPDKRIIISQIKKHPWLQELTNFYGEIDLEGKIEINKKNGNIFDKKKISSPKKIKIKYLSHNPSFIKEDKKIEKKGDNISDNISNHSDDSNQKISTKPKIMNFQNCLDDNSKNVNKNLLKELEIKYLEEFTSRKISIDQILKEQEDDGD